MTVALIDYGAGNLRSAAKALEAAGASRVLVTSNPQDLVQAERIVLPGVGTFGCCMAALTSIEGMLPALEDSVRRRAIPFLGICVGMQLMADSGHEFGIHEGLGWIGGQVRRMTPAGLKIPQIGWNLLEPRSGNLVQPGYAYFVHSYAFHPTVQRDIAAVIDYGGPVVAAVQRDNMLGVQFHPEKSQAAGLALLSRWLNWNP